MGSQRVKLEQVGKSAGMVCATVGTELQVCKVKGVGQFCLSVCGSALLHGKRSGLKAPGCFNPGKRSPLCLIKMFPKMQAYVTPFHLLIHRVFMYDFSSSSFQHALL